MARLNASHIPRVLCEVFLLDVALMLMAGAAAGQTWVISGFTYEPPNGDDGFNRGLQVYPIQQPTELARLARSPRIILPLLIFSRVSAGPAASSPGFRRTMMNTPWGWFDLTMDWRSMGA